MLRRLLVLVSAVVLVDIAFYSAITPLLPFYTDELDLSKSEAGALAGAYAAGTLLAALPAGFLAARWGPRQTLLSGLGLLAVACVVFGFAQQYELLVGARFVQGVGGAGSWAAGMSWLIAATPPERRGEIIGAALGVAIAGALAGPVLGALAEATSTSLVFSTVAGLAALLAAGVVATPPPAPAAEGVSLRTGVANGRVRAGAWLTSLPAIFFGAVTVLASLQLHDLGASAAAVAAVFLVSAGVEASLSPLIGRLSDRRGRILPIRGGLVAMVVASFAVPAAGAEAWLLAGVIVVALALVGVMWAPAMALISEGAEGAGMAQGLAFGIVNLAWAGGQVAGSAGGSAVADATSDTFTYGLVAVLAVTSLALLRRVPPAAARAKPA